MILKVVMALTGLVMVGFLLMHMYGNLKAFLGADSFNHYAEWLKSDVLYPLVPHGVFIWIFRLVMLGSIVAHMYAAAVLTGRAHASRSTKYVTTKRLAQTYASRTMRWGGVIIALGLVFHILQFTAQVATTGFRAGDSPYDMVVAAFSMWWVTLAYALWLVAVCLHVRHGVWSALTTLGANTSARAKSFLDGLAWVIAIVLYVGFMIMPLAVFFGWIN